VLWINFEAHAEGPCVHMGESACKSICVRNTDVGGRLVRCCEGSTVFFSHITSCDNVQA
jgi:hypothetical protein